MEKLLHNQTLRQFVKFSLVGVSNTFIDFFVYLSLTRTWEFWRENFWLANIVSFILAVTWSFTFNRSWTFRDSGLRSKTKYLKFLSVNIAGVALNTSILYTLVAFFGLYDVVGKAVAIIIVLFWNFFANKYWTFKLAANIKDKSQEY